jgi:hypothetical protein
MNNAEGVTELHHKINGEGGELVLRPKAEIERRRPEPQFIVPVAVSQSSYLNEKDRHYRAAETVENGGDLAERSANRILRLDGRLRQAEADGASPRALAGIERLEEVLSHGTGMLVLDFVLKPYERW